MTYEKQLALIKWFYNLEAVIKPFDLFLEYLVQFAREVTGDEFDTAREVECWIRNVEGKIK